MSDIRTVQEEDLEITISTELRDYVIRAASISSAKLFAEKLRHLSSLYVLNPSTT